MRVGLKLVFTNYSNRIITLSICYILVSVTANIRVLIKILIHAAFTIDFVLICVVLTIRQIKELILACAYTTVSATLALQQQLFGHLSFIRLCFQNSASG